MLSLLLVQLVTAQPAELRTPVAVVATSKRPGAEVVAPKITQRVLDTFKREAVQGLLDDAQSTKELNVAGFSDPKSCQGTRACLSKLAILLGPHAVVVGVDVGKVGKSLAIHLEAVAADRDESLATLDLSASLSGWSDAMSAPMVVFAREVKAGLELRAKSTGGSTVTGAAPQPKEPVARTDTPTKTTLTPNAKPSEPAAVVNLRDDKPPKVAAWAFAGGAVVTAGTAVALGIVSGGAKKQFDDSLVDLGDGMTGSRLPEAQAKALADTANTTAALAITSAVVTAGLGALSALFFLKD